MNFLKASSLFLFFFFFTVKKKSFIRRESILPDVEVGLCKRSVAQKAIFFVVVVFPATE